MVVDASQDHSIWYKLLKDSIRNKSESRLSQLGELNLCQRVARAGVI